MRRTGGSAARVGHIDMRASRSTQGAEDRHAAVSSRSGVAAGTLRSRRTSARPGARERVLLRPRGGRPRPPGSPRRQPLRPLAGLPARQGRERPPHPAPVLYSPGGRSLDAYHHHAVPFLARPAYLTPSSRAGWGLPRAKTLPLHRGRAGGRGAGPSAVEACQAGPAGAAARVAPGQAARGLPEAFGRRDGGKLPGQSRRGPGRPGTREVTVHGLRVTAVQR
jgi:hypothetical protein